MEIELQGFLERSVVGVARRTAVLLAVLTTTLVGFGLSSAAAARAEGFDLCAGYSACSTGSFTTHDYQDHADTSWWRMFPGDNCTNYAAYVESQVFGVTEPTYLLGDAYQWAPNAAANGVPVNGTPSVGAVAYWRSRTPGMGRDGHVGIVEAVAPDGSYIDVSESGMGKANNGYDWERIYQNTPSWEPWPDSFIHFPGTDIPQPSTLPPPPPVTWPQVAPPVLSWGTGTIGSADAPLQLPSIW
jgi:surface antigen